MGEVAKLSRMIALGPVSGRDGTYQGRFTAERAGMWQVSVKLPGGISAQRELIVTESDLEMRNTAMNRAGLQQFAAASGGKYFDIGEASKAAELIPDRSRTHVIRERPRMLWDNGYLFGGLILLVSLEWILRKKAKLL